MNIEEPLSSKDPVKEVGYKSFVNLVNSGHISVTWVEHRKIYMTYLKYKSQDQRTAAGKTSEVSDIPLNTIYYIIHRFE